MYRSTHEDAEPSTPPRPESRLNSPTSEERQPGLLGPDGPSAHVHQGEGSRPDIPGREGPSAHVLAGEGSPPMRLVPEGPSVGIRMDDGSLPGSSALERPWVQSGVREGSRTIGLRPGRHPEAVRSVAVTRGLRREVRRD
jgi:hypothetical protein